METTMTKPGLETIKNTSKIRKLIEQLPVIAGCENAKRLSVMFAATYDRAYADGSALDCTYEDLDKPGMRMDIINPEKYNPQYPNKARVGYARLVLAEFATYRNKGRITDSKFKEVVELYSPLARPEVPEIEALLTYEQAVTMSWWWQ